MEDFKEMITNAVKSVIPQQQKNSAKIISLNNVSNSEDDILTREEVKNILKVSYPTLWKYNNDGTLKVKSKIGRRVYYSKKDLNNLLNNVA
jgi:predicted DNA-binding transcriptional regulator AlpA